MKNSLLRPLLLASAMACGPLAPSQTVAQTIPYTGGTLTENFDSLGTNGTNTPPGWFAGFTDATHLTHIGVSDGSIAPNQTVAWNFGVSDDPDRALGTMATSTGTPPPPGVTRYVGVRIQNRTGQSLNRLTISYDGEQWRTGSTTTDTNTLVLQFSSNGLNYVNLGAAFNFVQRTFTPLNSALNGNQPANRAAGRGGTFDLPSFIPPDGIAHLRWFDANDLGTDPALAIDNFSFSASGVVTAPSCVPPPKDLVFWMPFDETSGASAHDIIGGALGTYQGTSLPVPTAGKVVGALSFNGLGSYVSAPRIISPHDYSDLTIDAWIYPNGNSSDRVILDYGDLVYRLELTGTELRFWTQPCCSSWAKTTSGANIVPGAWTHVAVTASKAAQQISFYVNGNLVPIASSSAYSATGFYPVPGALWTIGAAPLGYDVFNGRIDEVEVFERALSPGEIAALYNAGSTGKCKHSCQLPWDSPFCKSATAINVVAYICNATAQPQAYNYWFQGLSPMPNPYCDIQGPNSFTPIVPPIPQATVQPGQCLPITVKIERPAQMNTSGQVGCYQMFIQPVGSTDVFSCIGSVQDSGKVCLGFPNDLINGTNRSPVNLGPVTVTNTSGGNLTLRYQVVVMTPEMSRDDSDVSLNDLPPGAVITNSVVLAPGQGTSFELTARFVRSQPGWFYTLLIQADTDGDGLMEPLTSAFLRNVLTPTLESVSPNTVTGLWNFDQGDLRADVGAPLEYVGGSGGPTAARTRFGSTTSFGLPNIAGAPAQVMCFDGATHSDIGFLLRHLLPPNGGGAKVNEWTLIMDVLFPHRNSEPWFSFAQIDDPRNNANDGDLFARWTGDTAGIGISGQYPGELHAGQWHRVAFAVRLGGPNPVISKFVDGVKAADQTNAEPSLAVDGRFALNPTLLLFGDNDGESQPVYVNNIQIRAGKLADADLAALGGPGAGDPPLFLLCATNKSVDCGFGGSGPSVPCPWSFDPPVATGGCCGTNVTLTIVSTVTNGTPSCSQAITRTWRVTDCCSNSVTCSQTVKVPLGIPMTILASPADVTAFACGSASFTVGASGSGPFTYVWCANGQPIPGATGPDYTTPRLTLADHGTVFTVKISNACGSVTSAPAVLSVMADATPPTLVAATAMCGSNKVTVTFSEPLDAAAGDSFNYDLSGGVMILNAVLADDGQTVCLFTSPLTAGTTYTLTVNGVRDWCGNDLAANSQTTFSCLPPPLPRLFINEWLAHNGDGLVDPADAQHDDWFELFNPGSDAVDLGGLFLTDDLNNPSKFQIPTGYVVPPGGFLLVWADRQPDQNTPRSPDLHVNFTLAEGGGDIGLFAADGTAIDTVTYEVQAANISEGRWPDGDVDQFPMELATPRAPNLPPPQVPGPCTSAGTRFWLTCPANYSGGTLSLRIARCGGASGTVTIPGLGFTASFTIPAVGGAVTVPLPAAAEITASDVVQNKGIRVTATAPVSVYGMNRLSATADGYLALPEPVLGTDYCVLSYGGANQSGPSEFAVVACLNNTTVRITPSVTVPPYPAGIPYPVFLNAGETYQLKGAPDLSGTIITADKPIAVFGGSECANVPNAPFTSFCDHLVEQLPPTPTWGKVFFTRPLATRANGDTLRILARQNGTTLTINNGPTLTLNSGQIHEQLLAVAAHIVANRPVLVAQYANGGSHDGNSLADPFMMLVPATCQYLRDYALATPPGGYNHYLNLIVPNAAVGSLLHNGLPLTATFTPIGASGYSHAAVAIAAGKHCLSGPLPFDVQVYGWSAYESYGYPAGVCLQPQPGNGPCAQPPANMVLWLPFDEATGPTAANLVAGGNPGTHQGAPTIVNEFVARGLCFNGNAAHYVKVPNYPAINFGAANSGTGDFSIDAWVKRDPASGNTTRAIVDKRALIGGKPVGYALALNFGNLILQLADGGTGPGYTNYRDTGQFVPADNCWHHVAVSVRRNSTTGIQFYVDGVPGATGDPTGRPGSLQNPADLWIARTHIAGASSWRGCIDEVEIFNRALAASDLHPIWNAGASGKCKPVWNNVSCLQLVCPGNLTATTCGNCAVVNYPVHVINHCVPNVQPVVTCSWPSGSCFPLGTTLVTCTALAASACASCSFTVTVTLGDTQPPLPCLGESGPPYCPDFNSWQDIQPHGNATVGGGILKLTPPNNTQYGVAVLPQFNSSPLRAWRATFQLYIGGGPLNGGFTSADGFSFNLCDGPFPSSLNYQTYEEGFSPVTGAGLTVEFDTYDNDQAGSADATGIFLKLSPGPNPTPGGGTPIAGTVLQPSQGPLVTAPGWIPVEITMDCCGHVRVYYDGLLRAAGKVNYIPGPSARFVLAARTGGGNDHHWVRDLCISTERCGPDLVVTLPPAGPCCAVVNYKPPCFTDACDPHPTIVCTPPPGTCFPVGTNVVCCSATDAAGNQGCCNFQIIVQDTTPPVLDCDCLKQLAQPLLVTNGCPAYVPDLCQFTHCFRDNCCLASCAQSPAAGTPVGPGTYPILLTLTDCAGNTLTSTNCRLDFVVTDNGCFTNCCDRCVEPFPASVTVTVKPGYNYLVNPLCHGNDNSVGTVLAGVADQTQLYFWTGSSLNLIDTYDLGLGGWSNPGQPLAFGVGFILFNPGPAYTLLFVGCEPRCPPQCPEPNDPICRLVGNTGSTPAAITWDTLFGPSCPPVCGSTVYIFNPAINPPVGGFDPYVYLGAAGWSPSVPSWPNGTSVFVCWQATNCCLECPPPEHLVIGCPPVVRDYSTHSFASSNCMPIGPLTVTQSPLAGKPLAVPGPTLVTITVCDALSHCRTCRVFLFARYAEGCCTNVTVLNLFSGRGASGNLLAGGSFDPQFSVGGPGFNTLNPYVPSPINSTWVANNALSQWVGPVPGNTPSPSGVTAYTNHFFACSTVQATITGQWSPDDAGSIWLNGALKASVPGIPITCACALWHPVTITSGFNSGWNELVFYVTNAPNSPTGLRTELTGTVCCDPCLNIQCPPNQVVSSCFDYPQVCYPAPTATSTCNSTPAISCVPPAGSLFPFGVTTVYCNASDGQGHWAGCSFTVTVQSAPPQNCHHLSIDRAGTNLVLSWADNDANFTLEATPSLGPPAWAPVNAPVQSVNGRRVVMRPMSGPHRFFRLSASALPGGNWSQCGANSPLGARFEHSAVYATTTGEVIVWGGFDGTTYFNDGARYSPVTGLWTPMSSSPLAPRYRQSALWMGTKMIVWGGQAGGNFYNDGAIYDPTTGPLGTWTLISPTSGTPPVGRAYPSAVWTGTEMILWGGRNNNGNLNTGSRYHVANQSWTPLPPVALAPRLYHEAVWATTTGEMIVWGGWDAASTSFADGARYNPTSGPFGSWTPISPVNAPAGRYEFASAWTGAEMLVWGGAGNNVNHNTGARYHPATDSWTAMTTVNAPAARHLPSSVWTGTAMIVWGGSLGGPGFNTGGCYNPAADVWMPLPTTPAPPGSCYHRAVWTGSQMIVTDGRPTPGNPIFGVFNHTWCFRKCP